MSLSFSANCFSTSDPEASACCASPVGLFVSVPIASPAALSSVALASLAESAERMARLVEKADVAGMRSSDEEEAADDPVKLLADGARATREDEAVEVALEAAKRPELARKT